MQSWKKETNYMTNYITNHITNYNEIEIKRQARQAVSLEDNESILNLK